MQEHNEEFSDEEIEDMSEQELEALGLNNNEGDDDEGEQENPSEDPSEDEVVDEAKNEEGGQGDAEDPSTEDAEANLEPEPEPEPEPEVRPEPESKAKPEPEKEAEPSRQDRITEIQSELSGLGDKLENGDIDYVEYNKLNNALVEEREDLKAEVREAAREEAAVKADTEKSWNDAADKFLAQEGNDIIANNKIVQDAFMSVYQNTSATPEAKGKDFLWIMNKAKENMVEAGFSFGKSKPSNTDTSENKQEKPASRKKDVDIPANLGDIPSSRSNTNSEFTHLDNLEGMELEEAVAKMSPEQQDRWEKAS